MNTEWMGAAMCPSRADLPWLADADQISDEDQLAMAAVCVGCPALAACHVFVTVEDICGGFWAGRPRGSASSTTEADVAGSTGGDQAVLPGLGDAA